MEQNIETYFVSKEFKSLFTKLDKNMDIGTLQTVTSKLISLACTYSVLGENNAYDTKGLTSFLSSVIDNCQDELVSMGYNTITGSMFDLLYQSVLDRRGLVESEMSEDAKLTLANEMENIVYKGIAYHAFNSANLDSIRENGLNPNMAFPNQEEIDRINEIYQSHNINNIFGWLKLNCEGKVSFSATPDVSYHYGQGSPEWFSQFCGGATSYTNTDTKSAFFQRDHDAALANIKGLMESRDFTAQEKFEVLKFFEDNWELYGKGEPVLAIVPRQQVDISKDMTREFLGDNITRDDMKAIIGANSFSTDCQTPDTIDTSHALYARMPDLSEVHQIVQGNINVEELEGPIPTSNSSRMELEFPELEEPTAEVSPDVTSYDDDDVM